MISCRYVGSDCSQIGEREFDTIGQRAVLSEQGFREAVLGGAAFIPEEDFVKRGFSAEELAAHGPAGIRIDPPHSFTLKVDMAQQVFRDIRGRMGSEVGGQEVLSDASDRDSELEPVIGLN